jgi:hypothetical protein
MAKRNNPVDMDAVLAWMYPGDTMRQHLAKAMFRMPRGTLEMMAVAHRDGAPVIFLNVGPDGESYELRPDPANPNPWLAPEPPTAPRLYSQKRKKKNGSAAQARTTDQAW